MGRMGEGKGGRGVTDAAEAIKREIVAMLDYADERQLRIIYQFVLPLKEKRSGAKAVK